MPHWRRNGDFMGISELTKISAENCACGRAHINPIGNILIGSGIIEQLPVEIAKLGAKKPYILCDRNTYSAAGRRVCELLSASALDFVCYTVDEDMPEPDEKTVGSAIMHYDLSCDIVIAVGSGVINDTGKIVSAVANKPYVIVGTAPSMDGYASATSSMTRDGLKVSLPSKSADIIIGDIDINDLISEVTSSGMADKLKDAAGSILGGFFK